MHTFCTDHHGFCMSVAESLLIEGQLLMQESRRENAQAVLPPQRVQTEIPSNLRFTECHFLEPTGNT